MTVVAFQPKTGVQQSSAAVRSLVTEIKHNQVEVKSLNKDVTGLVRDTLALITSLEIYRPMRLSMAECQVALDRLPAAEQRALVIGLIAQYVPEIMPENVISMI